MVGSIALIIVTNIKYLSSFCKKKEPIVQHRVEPHDWVQTKNLTVQHT